MNAKLRVDVEDIITAAMERVMKRVLHEDPFDSAKRERERPLHTALVPDAIFQGSHFERRFVTRFGRVWEDLVRVVGEDRFGWASTQHMITGRIKQGCLERIQSILDDLEHRKGSGDKRIKPNWQAELESVRAAGGPWQDVSINCDVFISTSPDARGYAFELKAPQPNSDQTKVSKEKLLKLYCMEPCSIRDAYFALPYNPYGKKSHYDWRFPKRWFDMQNDKCVLIGEELWSLLGGEHTYDNIIEIARAIGSRYKQKIHQEYLKIER